MSEGAAYAHDRVAGRPANAPVRTVTHRLRAAVRKIGSHHPGLADHLAKRIKTGAFCTYTPDPYRPVEWDLG